MCLCAGHSSQVRRIADVHRLTHQSLVKSDSNERYHAGLSSVNAHCDVNLSITIQPHVTNGTL